MQPPLRMLDRAGTVGTEKDVSPDTSDKQDGTTVTVIMCTILLSDPTKKA